MKIIKQNAESVCPICIKHVKGKIYSNKKGVFIQRKCDQHGNFIGQIENDVDLYMAFRNLKSINIKNSLKKFTLPITHKCNLNCQYCYYPKRDIDDIPLSELKKKIDLFSGKIITFSGGEPTLSDNLPSLIRYARKMNKFVNLSTNGIELRKINYLKSLVKSGLQQVHFSLNSLDAKLLDQMHLGKQLLLQKKKALNNLKTLKVPTIISILAQKGRNDNEIGDIWNFCLKNHSFIKSFRIRTPSPTGKYEDSGNFFISDLLHIVCNMTKIPYSDVVSRYSKITSGKSVCNVNLNLLIFVGKNKNKLLNWNISNFNYNKSSISKDNIFCSNFFKKYFKNIYNEFKIMFYIFFRVKKLLGIKYLFKKLFGKGNFVEMSIGLRCWPNKYNIDLGTNRLCPSISLNNEDKVMPFCYCHIYNEKK